MNPPPLRKVPAGPIASQSPPAMTLAASSGHAGHEIEQPEGRAAQLGRGRVRHQGREKPLGEAHMQAPERHPDAYR